MTAETSEIANFYANKSIFITGATGFLGKVLLEKLLRSCPDLKKIYILVRHKKGNTPEQRINELINSPLFEIVKKGNPEFYTKLEAIEGDLDRPAMGISPEDEQKLLENVEIVFHSAATVRFDEPIKVAVKVNIVATKKVVDMCKKLPRLESFVHVSTAYANCVRSFIKEEVYEPSVEPEHMINFAEWLSDDIAERITPSLIGSWPNTYTFTKAIAESLVIKECQDVLPCAIVRPAIVGASYQEPVPGWIDNYNGATLLVAAAGKNLKRSMYGNPECNADVIPVDYCVNMMIVAGWSAAKKKYNTKSIPVYNNTISQLNRINWRTFLNYCRDSFRKHPYENILYYPTPSLTPYRTVANTHRLFHELLPAYTMDAYLRVVKKKPMFVRIQEKLGKAAETFEYFGSHSWSYGCDNVLHLIDQMSEVDKKEFTVDVRNVDWRTYMEHYCMGIKKYLLKEETKTNKITSADTATKMNPMKNLAIAMILFILFTFIVFTLLSSLVF